MGNSPEPPKHSPFPRPTSPHKRGRLPGLKHDIQILHDRHIWATRVVEFNVVERDMADNVGGLEALGGGAVDGGDAVDSCKEFWGDATGVGYGWGKGGVSG